MSRYSKEVEKYHLERVRGVMTVRPNFTGSEICKFLRESRSAPVDLHPEYVRKLQKKVIGERTNRARNMNLGLRIAEVQDKKRIIDERLWEEAADKSNPGVVRVMALKQLLENEEMILKMEMDSGFVERKLGTVDVNQRVRRLSPQHMAAIVSTMRLWGIVKDEEPEPIHPEPKTYSSPPIQIPVAVAQPTHATHHATADAHAGEGPGGAVKP